MELLDFADDLPDETDETQFKRHNRFLRSLREDTLLIADNFNVTASQDQFLDMMLKYRCRILFTTRSRYENRISLEVGELNPDTLLELVSKFFMEAERKQDEIKEIIALLHGHTFALELAARLLANSLLKPKELLKLAGMVKELNSEQCLDYGLIQQAMGSVCVVKGDADQAQLHHQRAMTIFEAVFEDEPVLLEEKRKEIGQAALVSRQNNQKLLV